ncbi:MAG: protein adenylyltransferase SelO [Ilumatobacteraceae bacterium]
MYVPSAAAPAPRPELVVLNEALAVDLGLDVDELRSPAGVSSLLGHDLGSDVVTVAQAYAGHQFGGFSPSLGDGRALLLGELVDARGVRHDLHLKGSGPTPFSRGGDGRAALGPMLREYLLGEAMHGLGIPTTRALAVVATGQRVQRDVEVPGAVLARVAASHLRVGTFQYAAAHSDVTLLRRLADHAIERHHPAAADADEPYVALFEAVVEDQASLVARWMLVGFVHGVMNTDNTTISGQTIDYGPCAFMDAYDPATVFSSIDHGGRYAYGNQPRIVHWNLARLGEALLALFGTTLDAAVDVANSVLQTFAARYERHWLNGMRAKLGLDGVDPHDGGLVQDLLRLLQAQHVDFTVAMRSLSGAATGDPAPTRALFDEPDGFDSWAERWHERQRADTRPDTAVAAAMDRVNPIYIPRNHLVEAALAAATAGDLAPFDQLVDVVARPFEARADHDAFSRPAPADATRYVTFCGT